MHRRSDLQTDYADVYGQEVVDFTRDLNVRDVSLRQEFSVQAGRRHLFETGFDVHALRTGWGWTVGADMTEDLSRAMRFAVTGDPGPTIRRVGVGLPSLLRSTRDTTRAAVWFQDRYQPRAGVRLEPGLRIDHSGLAGETIASAAARHSPGPDASDAAALRVRALHAEPRLRETPAVGLLRRPDVRRQRPAQERAIAARDWRDRARVDLVGDGEGRSVCQDIRSADRRPARDPGGNGRARRAVRISRRDRDSVPSAPIITDNPVNGATGRAYGFDVYVEKPPHSRRDRLSGWASYTFGVANITNYGRQYPADYDRRHSVSLVGQYWLSRRLDVGATLRVASGFPTTPAVGVRVVATPGADGSLVPLKDVKGLYIWGVDRGGVGNLNTARLPAYARLDLRVTFNPKNVTGRWQIYVEIFNALNRGTAARSLMTCGTTRRAIARASSSRVDSGLPAVPSFGVRYRF